jgi:hypothetical protein
MHQPPFTPRAIIRLERLGQLKNPVTLSGVEPMTFGPVAQCLNEPVQANDCEILMFPISILCNHPRTETSSLSSVIWVTVELHTLMFIKGGVLTQNYK